MSQIFLTWDIYRINISLLHMTVCFHDILPIMWMSQNLATGAGIDVISNIIPSLLNALRLVWIMSRHYNKEERMVPFLERISWEISARVRRVVDLQTLFKYVLGPVLTGLYLLKALLLLHEVQRVILPPKRCPHFSTVWSCNRRSIKSQFILWFP